ncbi:myo-inositol-1(or 4)-monophosphatase [Peptoniphilus olsenii]|uniref:Inositol-1-monophosphatase n=1 Tax=Peptoniphilus olsenii TaxID=411570 RepID=A0ABV2J9H0_9FIRM
METKRYRDILDSMEREMRLASEIFFTENARDNYKLKGKNDYVTIVDFKVQSYLEDKLLKLIKNSTLLAEEAGLNETELGRYTWVLDPVDGTTNLFHGFNHSVISLALMENGEIVIGAIYNPFSDEFFSAIKGCGSYLNGEKISVSNIVDFSTSIIGTGTGGSRLNRKDETFEMMRYIFDHTSGIRRIGSAALEMAYVACGRYDGFIEDGLNLWDYAAGTLIAKEAGAIVLDMHGKSITSQKSGGIICGNKNIVNNLKRFIY